MLLPRMSRIDSIFFAPLSRRNAENHVHRIGFIEDHFQWRVRRCLDTSFDGRLSRVLRLNARRDAPLQKVISKQVLHLPYSNLVVLLCFCFVGLIRSFTTDTIIIA
jgi:hypothetical protein